MTTLELLTSYAQKKKRYKHAPRVCVYVHACVLAQSLSHVWLFATPWTVWTVARQYPLFILEWVAISFSRGSSQPQGSNPCFLSWQADSLSRSHFRSPYIHRVGQKVWKTQTHFSANPKYTYTCVYLLNMYTY